MRLRGPLYFLLGAILGGSIFYTLLAVPGITLGPPRIAGFLPAAAGLAVCLWYLSGRRSVPFGRYGRQSNYHLAGRGRLGLVYFGALLALGVRTEMSTPFVWVGALFALTTTPVNALAYGVGFAVGRSAPVLAAAWRSNPRPPASVVQGVSRWGRRAMILTPVTAMVCGVASLSR